MACGKSSSKLKEWGSYQHPQQQTWALSPYPSLLQGGLGFLGCLCPPWLLCPEMCQPVSPFIFSVSPPESTGDSCPSGPLWAGWRESS